MGGTGGVEDLMALMDVVFSSVILAFMVKVFPVVFIVSILLGIISGVVSFIRRR